MEDNLAALALTDGLTGISNRRAFDVALRREWKRTLRSDSQMSLLLLDVDHFKELGTLYGRPACDDCLRVVVTAINGSVRDTDIVARVGEEKIAVILPLVDNADAVLVAEKIRSAIGALQLAHAGNPEGGGYATASIGVATALARQSGSIRMPESLFAAADGALRRAKHEGRNRVATGLLVASKAVH